MRAFICCLAFFGVLNASAQYVVTGRVLDENQVPVPYTSVALLNAHVSTSTGDDGRFALLLPSSDPVIDTLIVQCLGFQRFGRVQVFVPGTQLTITLHTKPIDLHEVEVAAAQDLPDPLLLLKDARKNVRKLYLRDKVQLPGYYREVRSVNGVYKEMNDALFQLDYTGYPQRKYSRRSYHDYYEAFFAFSRYSHRGRYSSFAQFWPAFVDPEDQVDIVTTRASEAESGQERYGDPFGGPVDLVAMDFVKYELHFLYPKLQKEYVFKTTGRTIDDSGRRCYVIIFKPKNGLECYYHNWGKKISTPFYKGQLTITVDSHVITGFDMESVDLQGRMNSCEQKTPGRWMQWYTLKRITGSVRYDSTAQGWMLSRVDQAAYNLLPIKRFPTEQRLLAGDSLTDESVVWQRSLRLGPPNRIRVATDPGSAFPILEETMRSRYNAYDSMAWVHAAASYPYEPPPPEVTRDLERDVPLNVQFQMRGTPIEQLAKPVTTAFPCMAALDGSDSSAQCLSSYQVAENDYADLVLQRLVDDERNFSGKAAQVIQWNNVKAAPDTSAGAFLVSGKDNTLRLCERKINGAVDTLLNLSALMMKRNEEHLGEYHIGPSFFTYSFILPSGISTVLIWDRRTGQLCDSLSQVVFHSLVNDSTIFYSVEDAQGRASHALCHIVFSSTSTDRTIKTCADPRFDMECTESTSGKYVVIRTVSKDEERLELFRNADQKLLPVFSDGRYTAMSADHCTNGSLMVVTQGLDGKSQVRSLSGVGDPGKVIYTTKKQILDFRAVGHVMMVLEYGAFNEDLVLVDLAGKRSVKEIHQGSNPQTITLEYDGPEETKVIYEAPGTPPETFALDTLNFSLNSVEKEELTWWAMQGNIVTEVLIAPTADGVQVPILVSYDKKAIKDSVTAILTHVYGAYGATPQADFDNTDYALMREGFVVAHAGVRGTGVLGRAWYDAGKGMQKEHSFDDFATALAFLESHFKVPAGRVFAKGISAGGLVVGNILNTHPELLGGAIMDRPFLNVYNAMMDSSHFLTSIEFEEWGDPHNADVGKLMRSYSPLRNIGDHAYPPLFLRGSEFDRLTPANEILEAAYAYRKQAKADPFILCAIRPGQGHIVQYRAKDAAEEFAFMKYVIVRPGGHEIKEK